MSIAREVGYAVAIAPKTHGGAVTGDVAVYHVQGDPEYGFHIVWDRATIADIVEITFWGNLGMPDPAYTGPVETAPYIPDPDGWTPIMANAECGKSAVPLKYLIHPVDADLLAAADALDRGNITQVQIDALTAIKTNHNYDDLADVARHILSDDDTVMVNCKFPFFRAKTTSGGGYSVTVVGRPQISRPYKQQELV